ncbi:hypothetical protein CDL12_09316 [Handroanthus impetiginosus]|uniref:F-box domain-containing protein n=1 Tax=Handroanthus impetiginosus TaxID=429701 RepID=A0A2G9HKG0_9LAMI|nr:hypothetical protein CDL12_09316 [Handroanthus impetiginosus]
MVKPELPQEILFDIFSRLPAKSVGKCGCLSKQWCTLLSTPQFIKSHLNRKTRQENLILITPSHSLHAITTIKDDTVSRNLELRNNWVEVVGSCDGLVLLINVRYEKILLNPITRQQVKVPDSPLALKRWEGFSMHGFGYDRHTDDYKIVTLSYYADDYYDPDNEYEPDCENTFVDVYSVKKGVWKRVENSPYNHAVPEVSSGAFVNGAVHWLASGRESGYRSVIVAFNFANEVFDEIPAPNDALVGEFVFDNKLGVLGGRLCMIHTQSQVVWIMEEYGVQDSWTKFSIDDYVLDISEPLCFIGDEEVVFATEEGCLTVYNVKEETLRYMVVDGAPAKFVDGGAFVGSLVSPALN